MLNRHSRSHVIPGTVGVVDQPLRDGRSKISKLMMKGGGYTSALHLGACLMISGGEGEGPCVDRANKHPGPDFLIPCEDQPVELRLMVSCSAVVELTFWTLPSSPPPLSPLLPQQILSLKQGITVLYISPHGKIK